MNAVDAAAVLSIAQVCAPLVHASTTLAIVAVESGFNQNAIGVVGGRLERQPGNEHEAIITGERLRATGWNFSVGLAQINLHNLDHLGLTIQSALQPCANLRAMQDLLLGCYRRANTTNTPHGTDAQEALRSALSCYYSGNFSTGIRHGYVARVESAARRHRAQAPRPP